MFSRHRDISSRATEEDIQGREKWQSWTRLSIHEFFVGPVPPPLILSIQVSPFAGGSLGFRGKSHPVLSTVCSPKGLGNSKALCMAWYPEVLGPPTNLDCGLTQEMLWNCMQKYLTMETKSHFPSIKGSSLMCAVIVR